MFLFVISINFLEICTSSRRVLLFVAQRTTHNTSFVLCFFHCVFLFFVFICLLLAVCCLRVVVVNLSYFSIFFFSYFIPFCFFVCFEYYNDVCNATIGNRTRYAFLSCIFFSLFLLYFNVQIAPTILSNTVPFK